MTRKQEIISSMPSCSHKEYYKDEQFREIWELQKEAVRVAFNDHHEEEGNYKIMDLLRQFEAENKSLGGVATAQLDIVKQQVFEMANLMKGLNGGRKGEQVVQEEIALLHCDYKNMTDVELQFGDEKCEIDDIVITPNGITLVEVKGYTKDIFIDRFGYIIKTGKYTGRGENIAEKMKKRERIVRTILQSNGLAEVPIQSILVFTDDNELHNLSDIQVCVPTILAHMIENQKSRNELKILKIPGMIEKYKKRFKFPLGFDAEAFKDAFADLIVALEEAEKKRNDVLVAGCEAVEEAQPKEPTLGTNAAIPESHPWWKKPITWVAAGVASLGMIGGGYMLIKKMKIKK